MFSLKIFVTVTTLIASYVAGAILYEDDDPDLILAGQVETQFGLVSWFKDNTPTDKSAPVDKTRDPIRRGPKLHKRCGSNTVICSGKHAADVLVCETLVRGVFPLQSEMIPEDDHRSICLEQVGKRCCINWSKNPQGAFYQDLIDAAEKQLYTCQFRGQVSAKSKDVLLGYVCVNQCMASWNHCSGPEEDSSFKDGTDKGHGSEYADHPVVEILPLPKPPR